MESNQLQPEEFHGWVKVVMLLQAEGHSASLAQACWSFASSRNGGSPPWMDDRGTE